MAVLATALCGAVLALSWHSGAGSAGEKDAAADAKPNVLPWLDSLARGYTQAQRGQKPILVRAGSETCRFCRQLAGEIVKPAVQDELKRWTLVEIDVDKSPDDARLLAVGPIPALRVLTPAGRLAAGREGAMSADDLVDWLKKHYDAAAISVPEELTETGPLDAAGVGRLIGSFKSRDAAIRESAIRRLLASSDLAAVPVVEAFSKGSLSTKLAALDLLNEWKAPVDGLDPWRPETLTDERLKALSDWGTSEHGAAAEDREQLSPAELADAREMLDRMTAGSAAEAAAIRERLARFGQKLLPEVYARLKSAESDDVRERLVALRYRLVETEGLALNWAGGIERLAASDAETRHRAADELAQRATAADEALLLELFSDPAPLVREISLRALMQTGGSNVNGALLRLLDDPEPNVRAAVLKQLAESPARNLTARIAAYAESEQDPDLVVHAIRVLREAGGKTAISALRSLLAHESWQVRAEAAEGLGKMVGRHTNLPEADKADIYVAMTDLLKDPDGFVVSRAVSVLTAADLVAAVDPLAETIERHPELAVEIVTALSQGANKRKRAGTHLHRLAGHADPKLRAAAIRGLCLLSGPEIEQELRQALADGESGVRIAAANGFFSLLESRRKSSDPQVMAGGYLDMSALPEVIEDAHPEVEEVEESTDGPEPIPVPLGAPPPAPSTGADLPAPGPAPAVAAPAPAPAAAAPAPPRPRTGGFFKSLVTSVFGNGPSAPAPVEPQAAVVEGAVVVEQSDEAWGPPLTSGGGDRAEGWLRAIRAGKDLPKWQRGMKEALQPLLSAEAPAERVAAVLPLAALGADELALPELARLVAKEPKHIGRLAEVLPWLLAADRQSVLDQMLASASPGDLRLIATNLAEIRSPQAGAGLWQIAARPRTDAAAAEVVRSSLLSYYFPNHVWQLNQAPVRDRKAAIAQAKEHAKSEPHWEKMVALALLLTLEPASAAEIAQPVAEDAAQPADIRADLLQVALLALPRKEAVRLAGKLLSAPEPQIRSKALASLIGDQHSVRALREGEFSLNSQTDWGESVTAVGGQPITPIPPPGLTPEPLLPLLASDDPRLAAQAGYLLALIGKDDGLPQLLAYWRAKAAGDRSWMRLVYRAIARLDDASQVPVLREIYSRLSTDQHRHYIPEFYWTIRIMTGPDVLALRKTIRDEVGTAQLNSNSVMTY